VWNRIFTDEVLRRGEKRSKKRVTVERIIPHVYRQYSIREKELWGQGEIEGFQRFVGLEYS